VDAKTKVSAPEYIKENPKRDLTSVLRNNKHETYENVDVLKNWPSQPSSDLDASQLSALRRIITKELAIIQGPPGTGKTFVSVQAIKIMLANRKPKDPPIIIACQTNHAVDQILRHIAVFEPEFARLGGRSKDREVIKSRTLYELRRTAESQTPLAGSMYGNARKKMKDLEKEMIVILSPLKYTKTPMDFRMLEKFGIITEKQADSLESGASEWVQDKLSNVKEARASPFFIWLGDKLKHVPPKPEPEEFGFDFEEADLAFEQLRELEAENSAKDDEDFEPLSGITLTIADNFTCRKVPGKLKEKAETLLMEQNLWKIAEDARPAVYLHMQAELKKHILTSFREKAKAYNKLAGDRRTGMWEKDETILNKQKVIGMTMTGLSKYRGLLSALQPKVVFIEEAAETLETPVTVACLPSLQQLILVGDHKQLRPHTHVKEHEDEPCYMNISLFERMVNNWVEFDTLSKQRRMIPEIRRILYPIYKDIIKDHASVLDPTNRPNVPGMGGVNSFFFTHTWPEQRDDHMSAYNPDEADMIVGFVEYLFYNGVPTKDITVLTFYNGQRKRILASLRQKVSLTGQHFNVVTVDSYQGEENRVVLLSLVRSNDKGQVGFLDVDNRVCVALSRAQCGLYLFGNASLLFGYGQDRKGNPQTWQNVIRIMVGAKRQKEIPKVAPVSRVNEALPLKCSNHNKSTDIKTAEDWDKIHGGCQMKCQERMPCGHICDLNCHPFSHDVIQCRQRCLKPLPCGHGHCENPCADICSCKTCSKTKTPKVAQAPQPQHVPFDGEERLSHHSSDSETWRNFAREEHVRYSTAAAMPRSKFDKPDSTAEPVTPPKLLDLDDTEQLVERTNSLAVDDDTTPTQPTFGHDGSAPKTSSVLSSEGTAKANGSRKVFNETFTTAPAPQTQTKAKREDWSQRDSLLD
jgi:helicase required for RNAi-mediated heterochromatin assembly 1